MGLQVVLFNGMEKTSHWAALYFVLLMTFGNYVLFNLLVAILVEGFSQEVSVLQLVFGRRAAGPLINRPLKGDERALTRSPNPICTNKLRNTNALD